MEEDDSNPPVACSLTEAEVDARTDQARELLDAYREAFEAEDELTLAFDGVTTSLPAVAAFVERERECCAFADYSIEVSPPYEETRLTITGPDGTVGLFRRGLVAVLEGEQPTTGTQPSTGT